ncbi:MAG: hypothetical protein AAF570_26480 [Bacteroidota bacterium]
MKIEEAGKVIERYKFVRSSFSQKVDAAMEHWMDRPLCPNLLAEGVDIFAM